MARIIGPKNKPDNSPTSWRDVIKVHPEADKYPLLPAEELRELAADLEQHGLKTDLTLYEEPGSKPGTLTYSVLDGRNRLDAMEFADPEFTLVLKGRDGQPGFIFRNRIHQFKFLRAKDRISPAQFALSLNAHRRHLTPELKRERIVAVLKANPELSNRQVAIVAKADHKTVARIRTEKESTGEIPQLQKTIGADGKARKQPRRKSAAAKSKPTSEPVSDIRSKSTLANGQSADRAPVLNIVATQPPPDPLIKPTAHSSRGSGSSTTSAAELAVRLLIDLLAHGTKADPVKVAELLRKKLRPEQIDPLVDWLSRLGAAIAMGAAS
jgi:hypothetical protein